MPPTPLEQLALDDAWAEDHARFLYLIFEVFDRTGAWPELPELQRDVARSGENRDLYDELRNCPSSICTLDRDTLVLSVRGMNHCELAQPLVERFLATMALAYEIYHGDGPAVIRSSDVAERLRLTTVDVLKLGTIIDREGWWFTGGTGTPGETWERNIGAQIMRLNGVQTPADYLKALARLSGLPVDAEPSPPAPGSKPSARSRIALAYRAVLGWQAKREHTIRDLLMVSVLAGLLVFVIDRVV
jgi:hypothetical protein